MDGPGGANFSAAEVPGGPLLGGTNFRVTNPRCACAARITLVVVCVCLSVCLSVTQYLTSRAMNRSTNNTRYSASGIGRKLCTVLSETAAFESYGV